MNAGRADLRIARYELRDPGGRLVAVHVRRDGPSGKSFSWERPDGTPGLGGLPTADLPLYGVHLLHDRPHDSVIVCEGERATQALIDAGLLAVGTVTGASATPSTEVLRPLAGRGVLLWPDADKSGREHIGRIAERLRELGVTPKCIEWPDAPPHADAVDFVEVHGPGMALDQLLAAARPFNDHYDGVVLADVRPETAQWLWPGRIPLGKVTVLDGDPGLGKSLLTLDLAARLSIGQPMADGTRSDLNGSAGVILLTAEDDLGDTVRPRFDAMGGDPSRVLALPTVRGENGAKAMPTVEDLAALKAAVRRVGARLVVIDPLMAYLPERRDSHRDQDVRRSLAPLARFAAEEGVAVLVVRHLNKSGAGNPLYRGGGSIGIVSAARSALLVAPDPDDQEGRRRILVPTKSNLSAPAPALAYQIIAPDGVAMIEWLGATGHTAETLLADRGTDEERSALGEAAAFLRELLSDGSKPGAEVRAAGREAGISERTLARARFRAGVRVRRIGFPASTAWSLAAPPVPPAPVVPNSLPTILGTTAPDGATGVLNGFQPSPEPPLPQSCHATGVGATAPTGPCYACHGTRFWWGVYGSMICARCHPLATPSLVACWWVRRPSGRWLRIHPQPQRWRVVSPDGGQAAVRAFLARQEEAQRA